MMIISFWLLVFSLCLFFMFVKYPGHISSASPLKIKNMNLSPTLTDSFFVLNNDGTCSLSTVATTNNGANMAKATSHSPMRRPQAPRLEGIQGCLNDCVMARYLSTDMAVIVNTLEATATPVWSKYLFMLKLK